MSEPLTPELRSTIAFVVCGGSLIVAGGVVAAVNSAAPFAHGSWLAAYLVLVGGTAQILLAAGRAALVSGGGEPSRPWVPLMLWNFGSLAVPAGVLADTAGLVTAGRWRCCSPWRSSCGMVFTQAERGADGRSRTSR